MSKKDKEKPQEPNKRRRVGVIGCGRIMEHQHVSVLSKLDTQLNVVAVADISAERAVITGEKLEVPAEHRYNDYKAMLSKEAPDIVHICTPPHLHAAQAIAAMQAGAHVLVETPLGITVEEADTIIAVAESTGRKLTVCHSQLYEPTHRVVVGHIVAGDIGRLALIRTEILTTGHIQGAGVDPDWRTTLSTGGGCLMDLGYHQVYRSVEYARSPVKRVFARTGQGVRKIEVEDMALLTIEHANGVTTSLQTGWLASAGSVRVQELYGDAGQIRMGGELPASIWQATTGYWSAPQTEPEWSSDIGLTGLVRAFLSAIEIDGPPPVNPAAARHTLAVIHAAYRSAKTGQAEEV